MALFGEVVRGIASLNFVHSATGDWSVGQAGASIGVQHHEIVRSRAHQIGIAAVQLVVDRDPAASARWIGELGDNTALASMKVDQVVLDAHAAWAVQCAAQTAAMAARQVDDYMLASAASELADLSYAAQLALTTYMLAVAQPDLVDGTRQLGRIDWSSELLEWLARLSPTAMIRPVLELSIPFTAAQINGTALLQRNDVMAIQATRAMHRQLDWLHTWAQEGSPIRQSFASPPL